MLRAIAAALGFVLWLVRRILFGPRRKPAAAPEPTLPASFQSVATRAFGAGGADKPVQAVQAASRPKQKRAPRLTLKYRVAIGGAVLGTGLLMLTFAFMMVYYTVVFPDPLALRASGHAPLIRILARDGTVLAVRGAPHEYIPLEKMAKALPAAVVATEDRRFFDHYGVDPAGMLRAMFANLRAGRFAQGGSTLTQQLAKNLFLTQDRTLSRKIAELGLALWLEVRLTKPEILELYLNQVYFGSGAYGVEAASERYLNKPASELTIPEAAMIAGLLKAPSKYSPSASPGAARARARVVITKMFDAGFISEAQETQALAQTLVFNEQKIEQTAADAGYVVDWVLDQLPAAVSEDEQADLIVETTVDKNLQRRAQETVADTLARKGEAYGASQAAMTLLDGSGGVRVMVGGRDYAGSQFNRVIRGKRQPGSAFKPFIYLAALNKGMSPDTIVNDAPITIGGWSPKNDDGKYAGPVPIRRAIAQSINTVAVRLNQAIGRGTAVDLAQRLGIKSELHDGPSLALGTSEVTLLEMAGAYAAFSNGGYVVTPHVITRITTSRGRVLYEYEPPQNARIPEADRIGALNDILNAAVDYGTGRRAALPDRPAAGKTGTTQDFRDAWFMGYTAQFAAGVWVGNDNGKSMNRATGGSLPAEIWRQVMRVADEGLPPLLLPGTVVANPQVEAATWGGLANRLPRVVEAPEILPWQRRPGALVQQPYSATSVSLAAPNASHPANSIGEDFIEKALASSPANGSSHAAQVAAPDSSTPQSGAFPFSNWW
ncbi:transglycosylase domain-containing protein [Hyphomicrobium sp. MC1]|uniref:transglycosylase domain-containing protein n=1 Tax=Hyphomicrobium sp. (strain MC1) TaxID=717785 RepID=UPI000213F7A0|nr:penicillin-binding protein 1A [Hyphomicrobium sp. MC1]CCB63252.1 penicillin-binding protein [Hyphomicrobium sp. MC1]